MILSRLTAHRGMAGFSLLETLAAISVASILAAIAIPHFTKLLPGIRLSSAARQIATDLQLARMRAISQHANQTVAFNTATSTYTFGADTRNLSQLYPGTTFTAPSGGNPVFTTTGTGNATTITISNNGQTKQVVVTAIGRVSIP